MKRLVLLIVFAVLFSTNADALDLKKYKIKSGIIEYKIEGSTKGTEILYFDDWGLREAKETKTQMRIFGIKTETNTLNINDKDWSYNIDLKEKTGTKSSNDLMKDIIGKISEEEAEQYGEIMYKELDARKVGNETVLGKNCEVWEIRKLNSKVWIYEQVPLKMEVDMLGKTTYTATKFEANASVPSSKFEVPKGIKITELTDQPKNMDELMRQMMQGEDDDD
jgi:hypothetical protein